MAQEYLKNKIVGFLGSGNMAQAIGFGLLKKNVLRPDQIIVSSRTERTHAEWKSKNVSTTLSNQHLIDKCDIIFLAVKPQYLDESLTNCVKNGGKNILIISVLAGVTLSSLQQKLCRINGIRIVRCMPNTPMLLGEGFTVYCGGDGVSDEDKKAVNYLFSQLGMCEEISEPLINCAGGLSGCGPAFAFVMIEALADGAVKAGIPRYLATKMAAQVLIGSGKMVLETGKHPGQLKDEVCSPGGCTIVGVHALESGAVRASLINAVTSAVDKSHEMTKLHK